MLFFDVREEKKVEGWLGCFLFALLHLILVDSVIFCSLLALWGPSTLELLLSISELTARQQIDSCSIVLSCFRYAFR